MQKDGWAVRDFIYLDIERVKSILSQIEQGLLVETAETKGFEKGGEAGIEGAIPMIAELGGKWQFAWTTQAMETKTLHDHIYNYTEAKLRESDNIIFLHEDKDLWLSDEARASLPPTAFVLIKGQVLLNDYIYLQNLLEEFNEIGKFVGQAATPESIKALPKKQKRAALKEAGKQLQLEDWVQQGLLKIMDVFYRNRFLIKIIPFPDNANLRVVGDLNPDYLRDPPESIMFKYGTAPICKWTLFGQIASIPPKGHTPFELTHYFSTEISQAMDKLFGSLREIEKMAISVSYPEISVTPIAVYRE